MANLNPAAKGDLVGVGILLALGLCIGLRRKGLVSPTARRRKP